MYHVGVHAAIWPHADVHSTRLGEEQQHHDKGLLSICIIIMAIYDTIQLNYTELQDHLEDP